MANEKQEQQQQEALPLLEGADANACVVELPVDGGRCLLCTVRRHPESSGSDREVAQVLFSFKEPFFGPHEASKKLLLHW